MYATLVTRDRPKYKEPVSNPASPLQQSGGAMTDTERSFEILVEAWIRLCLEQKEYGYE